MENVFVDCKYGWFMILKTCLDLMFVPVKRCKCVPRYCRDLASLVSFFH
jgi:hypothetical protein